MKNIENTIAEEAGVFDSFLKEFRSFIDRSISKKIFKKYTS